MGNPLLDRYRLVSARPDAGGKDRDELVRRYAFAIPTEAALASIAAASPNGVIELGAGTGYWARLLHERGVDVVAYDLVPPPSPHSRWFPTTVPWYPVTQGGEAVVASHADRTLLLVWPSRNEEWAARAAVAHHVAGGGSLAYAGEGPGGRTGDDQLHACLGHLDHCLACAYDLVDSACICAVDQRWQRSGGVELPHWEGFSDDLHLYRRLDPAVTRRPARAGSRRHGKHGRRPRRG